MGLADIFSAQVSEPMCKFAKARSELSEDDRQALDAAISSGVSSRRVCSALREYGYPMSDTTIKAHRNGECPCHR